LPTGACFRESHPASATALSGRAARRQETRSQTRIHPEIVPHRGTGSSHKMSLSALWHWPRSWSAAASRMSDGNCEPRSPHRRRSRFRSFRPPSPAGMSDCFSRPLARGCCRRREQAGEPQWEGPRASREKPDMNSIMRRRSDRAQDFAVTNRMSDTGRARNPTGHIASGTSNSVATGNARGE
jgi:hypothetical protein